MSLNKEWIRLSEEKIYWLEQELREGMKDLAIAEERGDTARSVTWQNYVEYMSERIKEVREDLAKDRAHIAEEVRMDRLDDY